MKHHITATAAALAIAATALAGPQTHWLQTTYNFGAFNESEHAVTARFKCVNTGDEPLVILAARANCGCTTPRYTPEPVAPGDTATITVAFDPAGRPGRFTKKVYVDTNTEPQRSTLTITGVVIGTEASIAQRYPVAIGPLKTARNAALLGTILKGHAKSVFINGYNQSTDTITPTFADAPKWLSVTATPAAVPPGEQMVISFFVQPDKTDLYGTVADTVTITPTPGAQSHRMPVVVTMLEDFGTLTSDQIAKAPEAKLSQTTVQLPELTHGVPATQTLTLTNKGKSTLIIRRLHSIDQNIRAQASATKIKPGKSATITITATAKADSPTVNSRITLITNDPLDPVQTIRITGQTKP